MKEGVKTSEFWLTLAVNVVAIAVLLGFLTAEEGELIKGQVVQVAALAAPFLTAAVSLIMYIWSRTQVKKDLGTTNVIEFVNEEEGKIG